MHDLMRSLMHDHMQGLLHGEESVLGTVLGLHVIRLRYILTLHGACC